MKKNLILMMCISIMGLNILASDRPSLEVDKNTCITGKGTQLSGQILDKLTHEPLVGAKVKLVDCNMEVYTDFDGNFSFERISEGEHILQVEYVSYETRYATVNLNEDVKSTPVIFLKNVRN